MSSDFNITIIGAGVIGLAIAAELSTEYDNIVVLEKHSRFGQETSSRNSEVIHSGIYYPTGSLKARLCVEGRKMLYNYCNQKDIAYNKCGKVIVATNEEEAAQLDGILEQSRTNGVEDGRRISHDEVKSLEPHVTAVAALYFPSTGIVDSHGLMKQLQTDAINKGVEFAYTSKVVGLKKVTQDQEDQCIYEIEVEEPTGNYRFTSSYVINAAGLQSDQIASLLGISQPEYQLHYWKGEYFRVGNGKNKLLSRLVYPVPLKHTAGLGVHATLDLSGGLKLGPNAIYLEDHDEDYSVDKDHKAAFYHSASKFLPFVEEEDLSPDQAGLRPKLQKPGDPVRDYIIREESDNGLPGYVSLVGIESPGLTSCLAIAKYVAELLNK